MKSRITKAVVMMGMVMMTATGGHAANPLEITDGKTWVDFHENGWVNWITNPGGYRVYDKILYFRTEGMATPATLLSLPQGAPTFPTTNRLIRTFSDPAGQFRVTLDQDINTGTRGKSTLKSIVNVENLTAAPLKLHLYERSDYAIGNYFDTDRDNVAVIGNRAFFSNFYDIPLGSLPKGSMLTKAVIINDTTQSPLPPNGFTITRKESYMGPLTNPTLTSSVWPMSQNGKPLLDLQWTLDIAASGSFSFAVTDDLLPAFPMNATLNHTPACSGKDQQVTYTINVDNYANMTAETNTTAENVKVFTVLPEQVSFVSATNNGVYDAAKRTVTWSIGSITPQSSAQTMQVTVLNPTDKNVKLSIVPSSDNIYPSIVADTAKSCINTAPTFVTPMIPSKVTIGVPYNYQVKAVDANDDKVSYSLNCGSSGCPAGLNIDSVTGLITWLTTDKNLLDVNKYLWVNASDDRGPATPQGAVLTVTNTVPAFQYPYSASVYVGQNLAFQAKAIDADGHALTYSFPGVVPTGMTITATGLVSWNPAFSQIGTTNVTVRVSDSYSTKDQAYSFAALNPISIQSSPPPSGKVGVPYTYQVSAVDTLGKPLSYTLSSGPTGMTINSAGLVNWTPTEAQTGDFSVTVKASDGVAENSQTFTVKVTPAALPYFVSSPITQATVGQQYSYSIILGNVAPYTVGCWLNSVPAGMTAAGLDPYIAGSARLVWTPTFAQGSSSFPVSIQCYDTTYNFFSQNFTITVNP